MSGPSALVILLTLTGSPHVLWGQSASAENFQPGQIVPTTGILSGRRFSTFVPEQIGKGVPKGSNDSKNEPPATPSVPAVSGSSRTNGAPENPNESGSDAEQIASQIEPLERTCFDEVNRQRTVRGLTALQWSEPLSGVARSYSRRMAEEGFFSHFDPRGQSVRERVRGVRVRWSRVGENLSYSKGYMNPVAVSVRGWMESPGHRSNILNGNYNRGAIGCWISADGTVYFTQVFIGD